MRNTEQLLEEVRRHGTNGAGPLCLIGDMREAVDAEHLAEVAPFLEPEEVEQLWETIEATRRVVRDNRDWDDAWETIPRSQYTDFADTEPQNADYVLAHLMLHHAAHREE